MEPVVYVDKLPESCAKCLSSNSGYRCCCDVWEVTDWGQVVSTFLLDARHADCPLRLVQDLFGVINNRLAELERRASSSVVANDGTYFQDTLAYCAHLERQIKHQQGELDAVRHIAETALHVAERSNK